MSNNVDDKGKGSSLRDQRNRDILRRMKEGDPLTSFDGSSSWFPPRPIIEKDPEEMARVYSGEGTAVAKPSPKEDPSTKKKHFIRVVKQ